ncbi:methyltransferase [Aureococcus anophagefferens]|nr:methyltransferase [Aureococcus anophagefferens]
MDRSGVENLVGTASTPYGKATYWSDRYTKDTDQFDWYQRYAGIKSILAKYAKKKGAILDARPRMSAKYGALGGLTFGRDDADASSAADGSVDCVVDKGTLDAVLCGEDSREGSAQLLAAALRVLKKKGVLLIVSHSKALR